MWRLLDTCNNQSQAGGYLFCLGFLKFTYRLVEDELRER